MGTRDDEYDYLFKGEVVGHREPIRGPRHSRGTRAGPALPWSESASALPSCRPVGGPAARPGSRALGRPVEPRRPSLCVLPDGCVPHGCAVPSLGVSSPSSWMLLLVSHPPLDRPLPGLSTHIGTPTGSGGVFFFFLFCSFPVPSLLVSLSWASARFARPRAPTPIPADLEVSTRELSPPSLQTGN